MSPQPGHVSRAHDAYDGSNGIEEIKHDSDQGDGTEERSLQDGHAKYVVLVA